MSFAALTQPHVAEMVEAAALLCPISYLDHVTAPLVERMVFMHLDQVFLAFEYHKCLFRGVTVTFIWSSFQMVVALGLHQINFRRF